MECERTEKKCLKQKRKKWCTEAEDLLLSLWDKNIDKIRGVRKNSHIYAEMATELASFGFGYDGEEVKNKLHNLTNRYREEKKKIGPSGGSPSTWGPYERVHGILGGYKFHNIHSVVDESIDMPLAEYLEDDLTESVFDESQCSSTFEISTSQIELLDVSPNECSTTPKPKKMKISDKEDKKKVQQNIEVTNK
ncbi:uncharacterized protein [Musca autumnalis]|uniref:uncharacterized protein n=1 Tax=Musca autumnalis TaxID=221902 RepID=UPI003CEF8946